MKPRPFHIQRPLTAVSLSFGLGVWTGVSFAWRPAFYGAGLLAAGLLTLLLPALGRRRVAGAMACFLFLGSLAGGWASHPRLPEPGKYRVSAVLCQDAALRENGTAAAYLAQVQLTSEENTYPLSKVYWTYTPQEESPFLPMEGERVSFEASLYHPAGQRNPYGFDFRLYLLEQGVGCCLSGAKEPETVDHPGRGLFSLLYQTRKWLTARVRLLFGEDSPLPEALLLGQRESLPEETVQGFSDAGTAHLLAVSGLHVGLLAALALLPLRRLFHPRGQTLALGVFLLLFSALLNFSAPVVRASLLLLLSLGRRSLRRAPDPLTLLSAAFLLILFFQPLSLFSASFQLSFCAALGIAVFSPLLPASSGKRGLRRTITEEWRITLSATLGVALPTAQIFHKLSLIGLALNPLACALFSALMPAYLLVLGVGLVWVPAGQWLAGLVNPVTRGLTAAMTWLGGLPFASVRVPFLPWYCVAAAAAALALLTRYIVAPPRARKAAACLLLILSFGFWRATLCRDVQYIQLSLGHADGALVLDGPETALIDAGSYGGDAASYLLSTGRKADHLFLTHLHADHCLGVAELLEQKIPIGRVYLPEGAEEQQVDPECLALLDRLAQTGAEIIHLSAGDQILLPRCAVQVTWPRSGTVRPGMDANRYSLTLLWNLDGVKLLTTGDLSGEYEMYAAADADFLKVAHHGSKTSTGEAFLEAVSPQAALISASTGSASLPHPDTLRRLQASDAAVYHTGVCGAVTVTVRQGRAVITPFLQAQEEEIKGGSRK